MKVFCQYCKKEATLVTGKVVYPHRLDLYDKSFLCSPCKAYVGCHRDGRPLGILANSALRKLKSQAHAAFDPLWREGKMTRREAYSWLSEKLGTHPDDTHIGMFGEKMCKKVVEVCRSYS